MNEANSLNINIFKIQLQVCHSASHNKEEKLEQLSLSSNSYYIVKKCI